MTKPYRESFDDLAGFLAAVVAAGGNDYAQADHRLAYTAIAGLNETLPVEGGFLVPSEFAETLWQRTYTVGQILSRCTRQPMSRDRLTLPFTDETSRAEGFRGGGVRFYWAGEGETVGATKPRLGVMNLAAKKLMALLYSTNELSADSAAMAAWLPRVFGTEAAFVIEEKIIQGTGADAPLGILHSGALITVAPVNAQATNTVLPANLAAMDGALWPASHRTAIWCMSPEVYSKIQHTSFIPDSVPVVQHGPNGPTILSKPVVITEATKSLGQVGDIVLFDPTQYIVAERENEFVNSIHVRFLNDENTWRFRMRLDAQPSWKAPIVPANCATPCSPYITLGARAE